MSQPGKPVAFMSYTRADNEFLGEALTKFREELAKTLRFLGGKEIEIFQDVEGIRLGQNIHQRIKESLHEVMILIPILTPSYFNSPWCREELELFLARERQLQRSDLILSIYYQDVLELNEAMKHESVRGVVNDGLIQELAQRLACDWRSFQGKEFTDPKVRAELTRIAQAILTVLRTLQAAQPAPPQPAPQTSGPQPAQTTSSAQPVATSTAVDPPAPGKAVTVDQRKLREFMIKQFGQADLELLCSNIQLDLEQAGIELQVNLEIVGGSGKAMQVLNLIQYLDRRGYLSYLVAAVQQARPGMI